LYASISPSSRPKDQPLLLMTVTNHSAIYKNSGDILTVEINAIKKKKKKR
jgi:hypothetical protein